MTCLQLLHSCHYRHYQTLLFLLMDLHRSRSQALLADTLLELPLPQPLLTLLEKVLKSILREGLLLQLRQRRQRVLGVVQPRLAEESGQAQRVQMEC